MPRLPRIPDILTTANLSCGVASILLASQGQLTLACWLVFAGAAFDVLDGWAARALGGGSELGKQLDSLADMVTFGVAPGIICCFLPAYVGLIISYGPERMDESELALVAHTQQLGIRGMIPPIIIAICSLWRLAKFNTDNRQVHGFLGLATPANALFWASLPLAFTNSPISIALEGLELSPNEPIVWTNVTIPLSLALGALMLSSIPLPSLKFKHMKWKGNEVIYCLLATGLCLLLLYGILAVPLILLLYLFSPLWGKLFPKTQ